MSWEWIVVIVMVPIVYLAICRFLNSRANYYQIATEKTDWRKRKYYKLKPIIGYLLISILLEEDKVEKKVIIMSILALINAICMFATALVSYYVNIRFVPAIFWFTGLVILVFTGAFANYNDRTVWDIWGRKKK